jgi:phosphohistidine phosphatase
MLIVVFRHGPAGSSDPDRWPDDRLRPLTEKGKERTLRASCGLARLVPAPDAIYTSPLKRAAETAKLLTRALGAPRAETLEELSPGGSARRTIEALLRHRAADTIVLVGHEPDLGVLAGALCGLRALPLKKAGACAIETHGKARLGAGVLRWMLPPAVLRKLAKKKAPVTG